MLKIYIYTTIMFDDNLCFPPALSLTLFTTTTSPTRTAALRMSSGARWARDWSGHPAALGARTAPGDEEIVFILLEGEWLPGPGGDKRKKLFCFLYNDLSGMGWRVRIETHTHTHTHSRARTQARVIHTNTHININTTTQTHTTTNNAEFLSYTPIH